MTSEMNDLNSSTPLLSHISLNPNASTTVVLVHGALVDGNDWDLVAPHLSDYHLLIPDLPSHGSGKSRSLTPFSIDYSARLLRHLIQTKAVGGKAHVVGHSLGAFVTIGLASAYPEVVRSVLVSGYQQFPPPSPWLAPYMLRGLWIEQRIENLIPRFVLRYLMDGIEIKRTDLAVVTMPLCGQLVSTLSLGEWPLPWPAPTLVIAATKGGLIPALDYPYDAVRLAETGRILNDQTFAVKHPAMRHPWNRQAPLLFAATIREWFENKAIPMGFERL